MGKKFLLISLVAVAASFAGGFFVANALNRNELNSLRTENDRLKSASTEISDTNSDASISDDELRSKIAQADANPSDLAYQKNLGLALYKYAAMKSDRGLLKESARILDRAAKLKKDDFDVIVGLGNAHFDMGYFGKDTAELGVARDIYGRALVLKPDDVEVRTDLGLTYFLADPPDDAHAIEAFQRSLKNDPKHAKTLEFLIQSLIRQKNITDAENYLARLRAADPTNETLNGLENKITEAKNAQHK